MKRILDLLRQWRCDLFHRNYHAFDQIYDEAWGARRERRMCKRCPVKRLGG